MLYLRHQDPSLLRQLPVGNCRLLVMSKSYQRNVAGAPLPLIFTGMQFKYMVPLMGIQQQQDHFSEANCYNNAICMTLQLIQSRIKVYVLRALVFNRGIYNLINYQTRSIQIAWSFRQGTIWDVEDMISLSEDHWVL